ncbi:hypothetical protein PVAP13_4KG006224 [Panicum virgatum]|uniref:Uncharacterized protein n=1 Tax=Panicum virgatum TaxID=38727 RepID=A0A8T0TD59_PANVG|nr:hypothetical protein PVAP13_4KG006224 [Panicum virgatum]
MPSPPVSVASRRTVRPPPRPRERIPLTAWDLALLPADYLQYGFLFAPPPVSTAQLVDNLEAALAAALAVYYPVVGCSVSVDCASQGVEILHAVADGVALADVVPPDADVPAFVRSFFPLDGAVNHEGHELPLFVVQITELADGVSVGFAHNHALSDGAALWDFLNAWAEIAPPEAPGAATSRAPMFERWSPDGGGAPPIRWLAPALLPYADLAGLIEKPSPPPPLRERMLRFSAESLAALKGRARQELLAAGDEASAAAVTKFQALSSLLWWCVTRARRQALDQDTVCRFAISNRECLRPPLPAVYFGNSVYAISTEAVGASELQARGHGWAAEAVGRTVAAHTDEAIRARVAAWTARPTVSLPRLFDARGVVITSTPRVDVYGFDFGWGKPLAVRTGRANKYDGKVSLFPSRDSGSGDIDVEVALAPEHMAALEQDPEFWAAVSPDARKLDH